MNEFKDLFLCKQLHKRAYQYKGGDFHKSWKLKERDGDVLFDSYEDYLASKKPKPKPRTRKKAATKKVN